MSLNKELFLGSERLLVTGSFLLCITSAAMHYMIHISKIMQQVPIYFIISLLQNVLTVTQYTFLIVLIIVSTSLLVILC